MAEDVQHSSLVGGSTAARRIACPGSYQMEAKLPPSVKEASSIYADEGTALHEAMKFILTKNLIVDELEDEVLGRKFAGYVMTRKLMDEAIYPCVEFVDNLMDELEGEGDLQLLVEQHCVLPGIPDAFGTSDIIFRTDKRSGIIDWKFGVGVPVRAEYDGQQVNAQLQFYARAAQHSWPHMFEAGRADWPVDLYIVQPRARSDETFSHAKVTLGQLEEFRIMLIRKVAEAKGDNPTIMRGDHCRFAPCKSICPRFTGPAIDLTKMHAALAKPKGALGTITIDWSQMYAELLDLATIAEEVVREVRAQAHVFLGDGNPIPGYKLVEKRAVAAYKSPSDAMQAVVNAKAAGCRPSEVMTDPEPVSPAQLRDAIASHIPGKATKKEKQAEAEALIAPFVKKVSSGTTIAADDDKRPNVIPTSGQLMQLSAKLAELEKQE